MKTKRITANLPEAELKKALAITGTGITETLVEGLEYILRKGALEKASKLRGKIVLREDLGRLHDKSRD